MYLIINFKTYAEATGDRAVEMAGIVAAKRTEAGVDLVVCAQAADIFRIHEQFPDLTVWAQHIDPLARERSTGWDTAAAAAAAGASGTLINHSEHPLTEGEIAQAMYQLNHLQLVSCLCVPDTAAALSLADWYPNLIAYEPPALIAGGKSLIDVDQAAAAEFISNVKPLGGRLILGAGITSASDIKTALMLGYDGVLVSSAFVRADRPAEVLDQLVGAFAS